MAEIQNILLNEKLRVSNPKINQNFQNINDQLTSHLESTDAHSAGNISYIGQATGTNAKEAIDNTHKRISEIVAQSGDDNTEIVDARGGYTVLGDRINYIDEQLSDLAYNVKNFGAIGDGVTDDTISIQAAIDAASTAGGGTVYFPPLGTDEHYIVSSILIPSDINLQGSKGSRIKQINDPDLGNLVQIATGAKNIKVDGLELDANKSNGSTGHGIGFSANVSEVIISNNIVRNATIDCIHTEDGNFNVKIINNSCFDAGRIGIAMNGNSKNIFVSGNFCSGSFNSGINVIGTGDGVSIIGNIVDGAGDDGITGYGNLQKDLLIDGNIIRNVSNNGIHIGGNGVFISDNVISNCGNRGIYFANSPLTTGENVTISGNSIDTVTNLHGIEILQCDNISIVGNSIFRVLVGRSITLSAVKRGVVANNRVKGTTSDGIRLEKSSFVTITSNNITGTTNGIQLSDDGITASKHNTISFNILDGGSARGIFFQNSSDFNVIIGNIVINYTIASYSLVGSNNISDFNLLRSQKGRFTGSGNGSATTFTIPHGLSGTPTFLNVTAGSTAARGDYFVSADATNITVTYGTAPVSGTNNVVLYWDAKA
ncbi:right-handed parallel beta-helix repeat-containing protein [Paenibacillus sp. 7516]|uniref:right-handed parallel beta-helix repeat-containing protein n=1 Tax=Paenibacillus sp. 7516 TaxID=2022549 RepID=UPI000BA64902|nr:right-handed parallel beta-helix repeat-containing protein [Paenibacillus sp. 7516]PAF31853.1 hypothetical protein CHI14_09370 [Paenibacillus sp. 7516]